MILEIALGFAVGIIMALTGAGGGILAVPLLVFGAQLQLAQAAPVGLLAVGISAAFGAALGLRNGIVRYRAALWMAAAGMLLAPVGVWLARQVDNRWLSIVFALVLLLVAIRGFRRSGKEKTGAQASADERRSPPCLIGENTGKFIWTAPCARALALSGAVAGTLSGLIGVGGGFVIVPALQRHSTLAMHSIIATSLAVIALVSVSGVASSAVTGNLNWQIALPFSTGALAGMLAGRTLSSRIPAPFLQKAFASVSFLVAVGMIVRSLG